MVKCLVRYATKVTNIKYDLCEFCGKKRKTCRPSHIQHGEHDNVIICSSFLVNSYFNNYPITVATEFGKFECKRWGWE